MSRLCIFILALFLSGHSLMAAKHLPLPPTYGHWLDQEVNYLITDDEKRIFLGLTTDQDRDSFIQEFWKVRNPDPNSPINTYEQEHYRRLAYANSNFGRPGAEDGWDTDRGMVYITLGPPQQRRPYPNTKSLDPLEIWFYQDPGNALAPYFYVLFYKPSPAEDFKIYSPYQDGPDDLIASTNAVNDAPTAIKIIQEDLGDEIANITLTLLPNEPVDTKNATPSLESDVLLNKIRNYRNLQENKDLLSERRAALEGVTHRVLLGQDFSDMSVLASRDAANQASVHYLFRLSNPKDFAVGKGADGRYFYSLTVESQLLSADGKPVYKDTQELRNFINQSQVDELGQRSFAVEGRLAAVPGKYQLRVEVTNLVTKQAFTQTRGVLVPAFDHALGMSEVFFAEHMPPTRDYSGSLPYSFSGVHIPVGGGDNATLYAGDPIRVIYQLWEKGNSPILLKGKPLRISYLIGQLGLSSKQEQSQMVDRSSFDPQGNLLMGTDLPTADLRPGNYRLVIRVSDPETNETTSQALNFRLVGGDRPGLWSVTSPSYTTSADSVLNLYRRGLCALAQQQPQTAIDYLKEAISLSSPDASMYTSLAQAYRLAGNSSAALATEKERDEALAQRTANPAKN